MMTQEDKQLLLVDLCARLPYGVKFHYNKHPQSNIDQDCDETAIGYYCNLIVSANDKDFCVDRCKLYLRPMSSMTEEEKREFQSFFPGCFGDQWLDIEEGTIEIFECSSTMTLYLYDSERMIDWLNAHHFDYRGLIERGLAIEVTEENNPYEN